MMDADNVQAISVLDALHMMKAALGDVKQSTIANCYRRAGFDPTPATPIDEEKDVADDNIPLRQLARIMGATSMTEFIDIDSHLPATEDPSEDDIIQDLLMQRPADDIISSEEEDETTTSPPPQVITNQRASGLMDILWRYLEQQQDSEELFKHLNLLERYITKKQLSKLDAKQMDITEFLSKP